MAQSLRIEDPTVSNLITSRCTSSRLYFVNNPRLEEKICAYLAKYAQIYDVIIYAFILIGNHYHIVAKFPQGNRASFMRDLNSITSRLCKIYVHEFDGGRLWQRRYSAEALPNNGDVEYWAFYTWLNPISSGLAQKLSEYPQYNSFSDAISGKERQYKLVNWTEYNNHKRSNPKISIKNFTETYTLKYARLPGNDHLSPKEYKELMLKKAEEKRQEIIKKRKTDGLGFATPETLKATKPGTKPHFTKTSTRHSYRPLVLTLCIETRRIYLEQYFSILYAYREASKRYRAGELDVEFPPGTYKPIVYNST